MRDDYGNNWPLIVSDAIYSHAVDGAPVAKHPKRFPVVLFSHGLGSSGFGYASLIEDLVSYGYVVAAVEHTYLAGAVAFPNGTIVVQNFEPIPAGLPPDQRLQRMMASALAGISEGAADIRFVLDKLTELNRGTALHTSFSGRLDLRKVAAMGHSAGGAIAARTCQLDDRFKACVDLEGELVPVEALPDYADGATVKHPLLFLEVYHPESNLGGTHAQVEDYLKKKEVQLQSCPNGSYDVVLKSAEIVHSSFSDGPLLTAGGRTVETANAVHNLNLTQSFIRAFLDKNLKNEKTPLLDRNHAPLAEASAMRLGDHT